MIKIVGKSWRRRVVGKGRAGQLGAFSMGLLEKRRGELKFFSGHIFSVCVFWPTLPRALSVHFSPSQDMPVWNTLIFALRTGRIINSKKFKKY